MPARIGPIMLYTRRLEVVVPFYRDALGLPVKSYEPGHSLWLKTEPVEVVLHAPEEEWSPPPYEPQRSGVLFWLQVEGSLEQIFRELKAKGAAVSTPVVRGGRTLMLVRDPEGRRIGLYRQKEAAR